MYVHVHNGVCVCACVHRSKVDLGAFLHCFPCLFIIARCPTESGIYEIRSACLSNVPLTSPSWIFQWFVLSVCLLALPGCFVVTGMVSRASHLLGKHSTPASVTSVSPACLPALHYTDFDKSTHCLAPNPYLPTPSSLSL